MFTGIIEEIGHVVALRKGSQSLVLTISGFKIFENLHIGDSIAVNGVCLTVTSFKGHQFVADVMPESIKMTTLANIKTGDSVNLERAMVANGRLGGHIVAGHVDGIGRIREIQKNDNSFIFTIEADKSIMDYVIYKGSIAIDGASLTVSKRTDTFFQVSIIPHTIKETILSKAGIGSLVNLETDITGRYIRHFMNLDASNTKEETASIVSKELLYKNGFI